MTTRSRPTSPHLQVYRWQISNTLSIMHRLAGVFLSIGLLGLAAWLVALASGPDAYSACMRYFQSTWAMPVIAAVLLAFFFHLLNGVRHLFWDAGMGFERAARHASGWGVLVGAVLLTAAVMLWAR
jgi:succinate dehydrogenase / fumarate reductase, cytochrome b subunit